jgi:hypothetical protein
MRSGALSTQRPAESRGASRWSVAAARTAHASGSLVAGYRLSFLIATGIAVVAVALVAIQLRSRAASKICPAWLRPRAAFWPAIMITSVALTRSWTRTGSAEERGAVSGIAAWPVPGLDGAGSAFSVH